MMEPFQIVTYPDPFLLKTTRPVENIDETLMKIITRMGKTMYQAPGVGLAAIQVGIDQSIIVYDVTQTEGERKLEVLINPMIIAREGEMVSENEGCLSVPELRADVRRAQAVQVEGVDQEGNPVRIDAEGFPALVLQHEIDHLNGKLFIDHISALKRELYKRRIKKQMKKN